MSTYLVGYASAQSDPNGFTTVIDVPPTVISADTIIESDTQVNVFDGGVVRRDFSAGNPDLTSTNVEINVYGGLFDWEADVYTGAVLNMLGGEVQGPLQSNYGGVINMSGGIASVSSNPGTGGVFNLSGGTVRRQFGAGRGTLNVFGGEYFLNGLPVSGQVIVPDSFVLSGTLADGNVFVWTDVHRDWFGGGNLTLNAGSEPSSGPSLIQLPAQPTPRGLRPGQTLEVDAGATVPDYFAAAGGTVKIQGGALGNEITASNTQLSLTSGTIGEYLTLVQNSDLFISGGRVGSNMTVAHGAEVIVAGGEVNYPGTPGNHPTRILTGGRMVVNGGTVNGFLVPDGGNLEVTSGAVNRIRANGGSSVSTTGGTIGLLEVESATVTLTGGEFASGGVYGDGAVADIQGGHFGLGFKADFGSDVDISGGTFGRVFQATSSAPVSLHGGEFRLDGIPVASFTDLPAGSTLSGTLADGSPFVFTNLPLSIPTQTDTDFIGANSLILISGALSPADPSLIDTSLTAVPNGLRAGQSMVVRAGTAVRKNYPVVGATLTVEDGSIDENLEISEATLNLQSGTIGREFHALQDSVVNVTGGDIGIYFALFSGSELNISSGSVDREFTAYADTTVNVSGGSIARTFTAKSGSTVDVSGGAVGDDFLIESGAMAVQSGGSIGSRLNLQGQLALKGGTVGRNLITLFGSDLDLVGGEFLLNGVPVSGSVSVPQTFLLTGTLEDGTAFIFTSDASDRISGTLNLSEVALPLAQSITVPSDSPPLGLRDGQSLSLNAGGALGDNFASAGGDLVVNGGQIGDEMEQARGLTQLNAGTIGADYHAYNGSQIIVSGGSIGTGLKLFDGASLELSGGNIGTDAQALSGSNVAIYGGALGAGFDALSGSTIEVFGGEISSGFSAHSGSVVTVEGGRLGQGFQIDSGAAVELVGGEFRLDGQAVSDFSGGLAAGAIFTATLEDGSVVVLSSERLDAVAANALTLTPVALPPAGTALIDTSVDPVPNGLRHGQSIVVRQGAALGNHFGAVGATITNVGGDLGDGIELVGSTLVMNSGVIGDSAGLYSGSTLEVQGGSVGSNLLVQGGSVLNLVGGSIADDLQVQDGGVVNVESGLVGDLLTAEDGGTVNLSGGVIGDLLTAASGGTINWIGTAFEIDGVDLTESLVPGIPFLVTDRFVTLSGTLADGTPFSEYLRPSSFFASRGRFSTSATLLLTLVAETELSGDYNNDGFVGQADLDLVILNWGADTSTTGVPAGWVSAQPDGLIGQTQLDGILLNWGAATEPAPLSVPEPAMGLLIAFFAATRCRC